MYDLNYFNQKIIIAPSYIKEDILKEIDDSNKLYNIKIISLETLYEEFTFKISKEMIMIYPPGIPVIVPGERFTQSVVDEIEYYIENKATILSDWNQTREVSVIDEENWSLADKID